MAEDYPDFEGGKAGLYPIAEWAAFEGYSKDFYGYDADEAYGDACIVSYTVTAGKKLYITRHAFLCGASAAEDADNNQFCVGGIYDFDALEYIWHKGGNGGGSESFVPPLIFEGGARVWFTVQNIANHNCDISVSAGGFEI